MTPFTREPAILGYHAVRETIPATVPHDQVAPVITARSFRRQVEYLVRRRYRVVSLEALCEAIHAGRPLRRTVAITFDDGDAGVAQHAWPILREHGLPAAVFVVVEAVGRPAGWLRWEQLQAMSRQGLTVGSHTVHHAYLPSLPRDQVLHELRESKRLLEAQLQQPVRYLSYPAGGFTPAIQAAAREAGYAAALTTNRGPRRRTPDLFALRRISMHDGAEAPWSMWAKTSGYYHAFRRLPAGA